MATAIRENRDGKGIDEAVMAACLGIESLLALDPGGRGLAGIARREGELLRAAERLSRARRVLVLTGFLIKSEMVGESDGPPGAASIARALEALRAEVLLVTDEHSAALVRAAASALGVRACHSVMDRGDGTEACLALLREFGPDCVVAVERPGRAADGGLYSMSGIDMGDLVPDTDALVSRSGDYGAFSIAIGDGGNELGMGTIGDLIMERVAFGEKIGAAVAADYLIVAGVSNWGAYGLVGALSALAGSDLLHSAGEERRALKAVADAGGVDGCTRRNEATVDGVGLERDLEILEAIRSAALAGLGGGAAHA